MVATASGHHGRNDIGASRSQRHRSIMVATTSEHRGRNDIGASWSKRQLSIITFRL
ncbi:hypothetical protein DPMN_083305 [Dreissena polymorpha]|uniref:Uncharacterized protein n=1 Tax=Dreissena polymorpha TaxID=45954 RepID=A0A9D3Y9P2_DREPO|nr:hypothetical protein DPMN_083305 [Dreissena polymorpha]